MADASAPEHDELVYEAAGLPKTTNWWGAFVIGLAGTILVTGIAPVMVTELGAASVPVIVVITISGYLVCLFLAELSAMMPDRSGGSPSYAYPAYKDSWPRFAEHVNGFTAWAYWLGWFPVAPLNMILASFYIVDRFKLSTSGFTPIHTPIAWWTLGISIVGHRCCCDPRRPRAALRHRVRDDARAAVDDPADVPGDLLDLQPVRRRLQLAVALPPHRRQRLLHAAVRPRLADVLHRVLVPA